VTAREGHQPNTPGGFPFSSDKRQYSDLSSACVAKFDSIIKVKEKQGGMLKVPKATSLDYSSIFHEHGCHEPWINGLELK
jgi:hypothetical protein